MEKKYATVKKYSHKKKIYIYIRIEKMEKLMQVKK